MSETAAEAADRESLSPGEYVDSGHPEIRAFAEARTEGARTSDERARALYRAVRDEIRYDPYVDYTDLETYRASSVLKRGSGYCVGKAALYAALCRAVGIPARVGFADVRNHLATPRLLESVGTDLFAWHGYVELKPGDRWVKATPTFNATLCEKLGVAPLAFDGSGDALLQAFDTEGREFMQYVTQRGTYADVPASFLVAEMARLYPALCRPGGLRGRDMEQEAGSPA
ncbi:MAG TPA: transglutaminase family protein [Microvirga sp.]|jgi:transglutaminase-like putative cysteine protease|nr:transglutaminase family protein [Microvirga sp.]